MDSILFIIGLVVGGGLGFLAAWLIKNKELNLERGVALKQKGESNELENKFKAVAGDVLRQNSEYFLQIAGAKFGDTEKNVKNIVESVGIKVEKLEKEQNEQVGKLVAGIGQVLKTGQEISDSAKTLKTVFSSSSATVGKWGEATLSNLLEKANMAKGIDFNVQETISGEGTSLLRPDFLVHLPGEMTLAIDSKASLGSLVEFEKALEEGQSLEEKEKHIENFIDGLRKKVRDLSSKEYQKYVDQKVPYVVMFVPVESALIEALQHNPELYSEAQDQHIMLASRSMIIPLILLIKNGWEQYKTTENATQIKNEIGVLRDRLQTFFIKIGKMSSDISQINNSFNEAVGSFETRVRPELERINNLGGSLPRGEDIKEIEEHPRSLKTSSSKK